MKTREETKKALEEMGFAVLPSSANFLFAKHPDISGESIYRALKEKGILIRHFSAQRIKDYNRITVGTPTQMGALLDALKNILKGTD